MTENDKHTFCLEKHQIAISLLHWLVTAKQIFKWCKEMKQRKWEIHAEDKSSEKIEPYKYKIYAKNNFIIQVSEHTVKQNSADMLYTCFRCSSILKKYVECL